MMKYPIHLLLLFGTVSACKAQQYVPAGGSDGITVSYRWKHATGKPSELLVKLVNASDSAREVHVELDLYYQGLTVERFTADTCITAKRSMAGKFNGIYFTPQSLTPEQAASPDTQIEMTGFSVEPTGGCR